MKVKVESSVLRLEPKMIIGEGGEALVYDIGHHFAGEALKVYRLPSDSFYAGNDAQAKRNRDGAAERLALHQRKLPAFPKGLPSHVITPRRLASDENGQIIGYTMPFLKGSTPLRDYSQVGFRRQNNIANSVVRDIFLGMYPTVLELHKKGVVIGDFNYLNVLVQNIEAFLIDADSMQFGNYAATTFTTRFVDPLVCEKGGSSLVQNRPHSETTDWYAYALMLFESLMLMHPYGGVYKPKDKRQRMSHDARPLNRISVLHPDVIVPAAAVALDRLSDDVLHYYSELLGKDKRNVFPIKLLTEMHWIACSKCGTEHAKAICPVCGGHAPAAAVRELIRGNLRLVHEFSTAGTILEACLQEGTLRHLVGRENAFFRESGKSILNGTHQHGLRYRLVGDNTALGLDSTLIVLDRNGDQKRIAVDRFRDRFPVFDSNSRHLFWISAGRLLRDDVQGDKFIGQVLEGQTLFWVGQSLGFGFYQAGALCRAFVFDTERGGLNDSVDLPRFNGEIVDVSCSFTSERCWLFVAVKANGKIFNRCFVIARTGTVLATAEAEEDDGSWLERIHSKCAATMAGPNGEAIDALFAVKSDVLVRLEHRSGQIVEAAEFPQTQGLLVQGDRILLSGSALFVINRQKIDRIELR